MFAKQTKSKKRTLLQNRGLNRNLSLAMKVRRQTTKGVINEGKRKKRKNKCLQEKEKAEKDVDERNLSGMEAEISKKVTSENC